MKTEILTACDHLAGAALNGIGQGVLLAVVVGLCLRALGPTNAATRHAVWLGTLVLLVVIIPAHLWRDRLVSALRDPMADPPGLELKPTSLARSLPELDDQPGQSQALTQNRADGDPPSALPSPRNFGQSLAGSGISAGQSNDAFRPAVPPWLRPGSWHLDIPSAIPRAGGVVLVALWLVVLGIKMPLLFWRLYRLRELKKSSLPAGAELNQLFEKLHARLGVTRKVELRVSPVYRSAVVLGFIHPAVLIPAEEHSARDVESAEHVLGHELAHVRRRDDWANLFQQSVQAALFFHPAVWWVSKRLALEREIACDDFVLQQDGRPQAYALLLVNLAGRRKGCQPLLAPGVSTGKCQLQQRIDMILNAHRNTSPRLAKTKLGFITAATVLAGLLVLYAGPRLVLAQNLTPAAQAETPEVSEPAASPDIALAHSLPQPGVEVGLARAAALAPAAPADAETGPRFKPGDGPSEDAVPPAAPPPPRKPRPAAVPRPLRLADTVDRGANIEERLDRLEKMVKSLLAQQNPKRGRIQSELSGNDEEANQFKADAKLEAARAAELDKRASRQAERAVKLEEKWREKGPVPEAFQKQLQGLHQQREMLQREMEKLDHQIERLKRDQQRLDGEKQRRGPADGEEPKDGESARK